MSSSFVAPLIDVIQDAGIPLAQVQYQTRIRSERILGIRDGVGNFSSFWIVFNAVPATVKIAYLLRLLDIIGRDDRVHSLLACGRVCRQPVGSANVHANTGLLRCWLCREFGVTSKREEDNRLGVEVMPYGCIRVDGVAYEIPGFALRDSMECQVLPQQSLWLRGDRLHPDQARFTMRHREIDFSLVNATIQALRDLAIPRRSLFETAIDYGAGSALERQWPEFRSSGSLRVRTWSALLESLPQDGQLSFVLHTVFNYGLQDAFLRLLLGSRSQMVVASGETC